MSLESQIAAAKAKAAAAKAIKDREGTPLSGQDLTDFSANMNDAASNATDAMADDYYSGLTPSLVPKQGEDMLWTDHVAACAAEVDVLYPGNQQQTQLNDLYTVEQKASAAIAEVQ